VITRSVWSLPGKPKGHSAFPGVQQPWLCAVFLTKSGCRMPRKFPAWSNDDLKRRVPGIGTRSTSNILLFHDDDVAKIEAPSP
jgi:hypothetical protein